MSKCLGRQLAKREKINVHSSGRCHSNRQSSSFPPQIQLSLFGFLSTSTTHKDTLDRTRDRVKRLQASKLPSLDPFSPECMKDIKIVRSPTTEGCSSYRRTSLGPLQPRPLIRRNHLHSTGWPTELMR